MKGLVTLSAAATSSIRVFEKPILKKLSAAAFRIRSFLNSKAALRADVIGASDLSVGSDAGGQTAPFRRKRPLDYALLRLQPLLPARRSLRLKAQVKPCCEQVRDIGRLWSGHRRWNNRCGT